MTKLVVIDTSTLVSAVLRPASVPRQAFLAAVGGGELCTSRATSQELNEVLRRAKFDRYASREERLAFGALVASARPKTLIFRKFLARFSRPKLLSSPIWHRNALRSGVLPSSR